MEPFDFEAAKIELSAQVRFKIDLKILRSVYLYVKAIKEIDKKKRCNKLTSLLLNCNVYTLRNK